MSSTTKQQNLDRVRENQRRSRQRKRDYIADLETRIRAYDAQGVVASIEVQTAARKVVEENRKLRALLHRHNVSDDIIDVFIRSGGGMGLGSQDQPLAPQYPYGVPPAGQAVQNVDALLMPRRLANFDAIVSPTDSSGPTSPTTGWEPVSPAHHHHHHHQYGGGGGGGRSLSFQPLGGAGHGGVAGGGAQSPTSTEIPYGMVMDSYHVGVESYPPPPPVSALPPPTPPGTLTLSAGAAGSVRAAVAAGQPSFGQEGANHMAVEMASHLPAGESHGRRAY